jgi:hypothetical protein
MRLSLYSAYVVPGAWEDEEAGETGRIPEIAPFSGLMAVPERSIACE